MPTGTGAIDYAYGAAGEGVRPANGNADATYTWGCTAAGLSPKVGAGTISYSWALDGATGENGDFLPDDRFRIAVQETRGDKQILQPDLTVSNLRIQRILSGPCMIECDVDFRDPTASGIYFKPWEHYIHVEKVVQGKRKIWATGIVQPSDVDERSGILHLRAKGFACYPKSLPWLEDLNWLANDAFTPVVEIWRHLQQDYSNGDLGVTVFPQTSGVIQLPGYAFDGNLLNLNFFATFVRQTDRLDCGDYIDALAKVIPFDYVERSQWNSSRTDVIKRIQLGYPRLGVVHEHLAFVINENVLSAKPHTETEIDWVSDIGVAGWFPGLELSSELANADPDRLRRYLFEEDVFIDTNERAAAWGHRRLARRQTPPYWEEITIIPDHPNAPFGTFDVGDTIPVSGFMPWEGEITQLHKIMAITVDEAKNEYKLTLKAEGAFNYDPIFFPSGVSNIVSNSGFDNNLNGWTPSGPGWTHDSGQGGNRLGSATITADGADHEIITQAFGVNPFQIFPLAVKVKCSGVVSQGDAVQLVAQFYNDSLTPTQAFRVSGLVNPVGAVPWQRIGGNVIAIPPNTKCALRLRVTSAMTAGKVWFDDAEMVI
ncbi:hypothetical protein [Mycobacterium canetti]|uniref:hypothetical protein n=1 Tax=Mycobacterium canetti TaxID=78331 RepID=UPI0003484E32|nr:hypothetical protein [Mycobacterium canetti]